MRSRVISCLWVHQLTQSREAGPLIVALSEAGGYSRDDISTILATGVQ